MPPTVQRKRKIRSVWHEYGCISPGFAHFRAGARQVFSLSRASRFRLALEELGGLFAAFGRFLSGRADLLPTPHLVELEQIRVPLLAPCSIESHPAIRQRLSSLSQIGNTAYSRHYQAEFEGRQVILEVFARRRRNGSPAKWRTFRDGIRLLKDERESAVAQERVLEQFRSWLLLDLEWERKRSMLRNLQSIPADCVTRFPPLVEDLQSEEVLAYERLSGKSLDSILELEGSSGTGGRDRRLQPFFEAFLEQCLFLSVIPAWYETRRLLQLEGGGIGIGICPPLDSVPPECSHDLLQYVASSVAGDRSRAIQMLGRMTGRQGAISGEQQLWQALSALQPELEPRTPFSESASTLNAYWRALGVTGRPAPLFLQLFQAVSLKLGRLNAGQLPEVDLLAESLWPVLARIMRFRLGASLTPEKIREWLVGTGLVFFATARQMGLFLEQIRASDLAVRLNIEQQQPQRRGGRKRLVRAGTVLVLLLFFGALQVAFLNPGTGLGTVASLVAGTAAVLLLLFLARID